MNKLIIGLLLLSLCGCNYYTEEPEKVIISAYAIKEVDSFDLHTTDSRLLSRLVVICLEGHSYYWSTTDYLSFLASKLTDDGKPVLCGQVVEEVK